MKCGKCDEAAIFDFPRYCKTHFSSFIEEKVRVTIRKYALFKKKDNIAVAVSGGKDSMSLLYLLNKSGYMVTAIAIDEGISGYRDRTLYNMKEFCLKNNIRFRINSFKEEFGIGLDEIIKKKKVLPCTVCGVFRRRLLSVGSRGFDALATGHNMDDEAQAVIMNLLKSNVSLLSRLGPLTGTKNKEFTKRVKPFYLCSEREIMAYSIINGLNTDFEECPYVRQSFRLRVRDMLNGAENMDKGTKKRIIDSFLGIKVRIGGDSASQTFCRFCHEPSANETCSVCAIARSINPSII
jgi:uncharacterized protein (TIGR00269 family)